MEVIITLYIFIRRRITTFCAVQLNFCALRRVLCNYIYLQFNIISKFHLNIITKSLIDTFHYENRPIRFLPFKITTNRKELVKKLSVPVQKLSTLRITIYHEILPHHHLNAMQQVSALSLWITFQLLLWN